MKESNTPKAKPAAAKQRIGDSLIESKLINQQQLRLALAKQSQTGNHLGSILIEMGFITIENLLDFLAQQSGVPAINLYEVQIDKALLDQIPKEKIFNAKILPVSADKNSLTLAMVNPHDFETVSEIGFLIGKKVKPTIVPSFMMEAARKILLTEPSGGLDGDLIHKMVDASREKTGDIPSLITLLQYLARSKANDMLFSAGAPPSLKVSNEVRRLSMKPLRPEDCETYARELLSTEEWDRFSESNDFGIAVTYPSIGRFRVNIFRQRSSIAIAIRNLPEAIPSLTHLNLPDWLRGFALKPQGLILVGGPAGHGKSTTLCAMVDVINTNRRCNIITLEDPVEYLQREYGKNKPTISDRKCRREPRILPRLISHWPTCAKGALSGWKTASSMQRMTCSTEKSPQAKSKGSTLS